MPTYAKGRHNIVELNDHVDFGFFVSARSGVKDSETSRSLKRLSSQVDRNSLIRFREA